MNKTQFYLHFETMPKGTAQQKGVYVRNGRPHFYRKDNVNSARHKFIIALRPNKPKEPISRPVRLYLWFAYDVKDKKKWGKYKPTVPDVDNIAKEFVDSMKAVGYFVDDAVVVDLRVIKSYAEQASIMVQYEVIEQ